MHKLQKYILLMSFLTAGKLDLGDVLPEIDQNFLNIDNKMLALDDVKGTAGTLVIFSCNTCPWVIKWEDRYVSLADIYTSKGIGFFVVNSNASRFDGVDSIEKMKKHAEKMNYNFPYVQDSGARLANLFGASKTPQIYLFDKRDRLVYTGAIDDNARDVRDVQEHYLINAIDELLSNKKITKPVSKAIGCSIKFP